MEGVGSVSLLDLPAEIRNLIYALVWQDALHLPLTPSEIRDVERYNIPTCYQPGLLPLAYTSRQIRQEFLSLYYSSFIWRFTIPFVRSRTRWRKTVDAFLLTVGELGDAVLRKVHLRACVCGVKVQGKIGIPGIILSQHIGVMVEVSHESPFMTVAAISGDLKAQLASLKCCCPSYPLVWAEVESAIQEVFASIADDARTSMMDAINRISKQRTTTRMRTTDIQEILHAFEMWEQYQYKV
jgi:hypothetical protein